MNTDHVRDFCSKLHFSFHEKNYFMFRNKLVHFDLLSRVLSSSRVLYLKTIQWRPHQGLFRVGMLSFRRYNNISKCVHFCFHRTKEDELRHFFIKRYRCTGKKGFQSEVWYCSKSSKHVHRKCELFQQCHTLEQIEVQGISFSSS